MTDPRLHYPYRHGVEPEGFVGTGAVWRGTAPPPTRDLARVPGGMPLAWQQQQQQQRPYQPSPFAVPQQLHYAYGDGGGASDDDGDDDDEDDQDGGQDGSEYGEGSDVEYSGDEYSPPASPAWGGNGGGYVSAPMRPRW
ncbi:hypothetical protein pqer_cds_49 [Pandoravirus quercus]|uniref:Uncharacterized protein n=2 Tax=Pandoravirus TaxID=2060084 RepID=A0A2U7U7R7_9VIRU|nr:hypothetical protein pqer_cds_49 [Pandoravirus quercus]AVK74471.1 hypothetical protein pqer_cds_49 [Pandoravirus quercus]QBZ80643.1 hypothetical protein pclt_cds_45 [Pandoravirus celtis]